MPTPPISTADPAASAGDLPDRLRELPLRLAEVYLAHHPGDSGADDTPPKLIEACRQLAATLSRLDEPDAEDPDPAGTATELGEYALQLAQALADWARQLSDEELVEGFHTLTVDLALWVAERGGRLLSLEPIVDALAVLANATRDTTRLEALFWSAGRLRDAVSPALRQDLEKTNPGRPWRLLNLNRAIVATRTHCPEYMETAFEDLVVDFPEDAPTFFAQGMEQMDLLNYPAAVREVMERYYQAWSVKRALH